MVTAAAGENQCEVVLVGCGAPKAGMGWYHAVQMIKNKCESAKLCFVVEPWFMGPGTYSFFSLLGLFVVVCFVYWIFLKSPWTFYESLISIRDFYCCKRRHKRDFFRQL
jgi:hypothetical protein